MKMFFLTAFLLILSLTGHTQSLPVSYRELIRFVQAAPNQGETNSCWYVASTGAMELLLNKKDQIKNPKMNSKNDLSESFLIHQRPFYDEDTNQKSWLETAVLNFNHQEAVHNKFWPFNAFNDDGEDSDSIWFIHPEFSTLPKMKVPPVKTKLLFLRGKNRWSTEVLEKKDIETIKRALVKHRSPILVNYNDDNYWHVVLIVGYDDRTRGSCYELEAKQCNSRGAFLVRDSNGKRYEARAYNWFLYKGNSAAVVEFK